MLRRIVAIILSLIMVTSFSACGKKQSKKALQTTSPVETKLSLEDVVKKTLKQDETINSGRFELISNQEFTVTSDQEVKLKHAMRMTGKLNKESKTLLFNFEVRDRNSNTITKSSCYAEQVSDAQTDIYYQLDDGSWMKVTVPMALFQDANKVTDETGIAPDKANSTEDEANAGQTESNTVIAETGDTDLPPYEESFATDLPPYEESDATDLPPYEESDDGAEDLVNAEEEFIIAPELREFLRLSDGLSVINGSNCYEILFYIDKDSILELAKKNGYENEGLSSTFMDGASITVRFYINSESYQLCGVRLNMEHLKLSDFIKSLSGLSIGSNDMSLDYLNAEMTINEINKVESFSVPDDIKEKAK